MKDQELSTAIETGVAKMLAAARECPGSRAVWIQGEYATDWTADE